ncbi:unnamed protein product, partial [Staurois parvus]
MLVSSTYQCCQSVPPISASQWRVSVCISAAYQCPSVLPNSAAFQCPSVMPVNAHQCHLPVPLLISATCQCSSAQPISAHHCSLI